MKTKTERQNIMQRNLSACTHARDVLVPVSPYYRLVQREAMYMVAFAQNWENREIEYLFD